MMPAFNAERFIAQAVESLLAQSWSNWELIIINDGSSDQTAEILSGYNDPRVKVFSQPNQGEAAARNAALSHVQGDFLAFLDADDAFLPHHLEHTADFLSSHPDFGGVYTDGIYIDQDGNQIKQLSARRRGPFEGDIFEEAMRSSDVFGAPVCVVLRSQVIKDHALRFDPDIIIGPDWDFLTQVAEVTRFGYIDQVTCLYRVHQTNISLRTGLEKRVRSLIRCREKTIQMRRFGACSAQARAFVFYDLLINLLRGNEKQQDKISQHEEFQRLPADHQSRLLRLMASQAVLDGRQAPEIQKWLGRASGVNPGDLRSQFLNAVYRLHPAVCRWVLGLKKPSNFDPRTRSPFADLFNEST